ncbi:DEAD/DEAH box helicase, partial [Coleofasciculus sp. LEGE 07092]|uniref:DEAD/DEAH box helicase n=2 Tax=unclassified Coleofasciculus TaxID=2692782 RepID=UPI00188063A0
MAVIDIEHQGRKFITTEPLKDSGEVGEQKVWDATKSAFLERNCVAYWRYPIFSKVGELRKEPDILIADRELGLIVIEVRSVTIDQIAEISDRLWQFQNVATTEANPYQQGEHQLRALIGYCDREPAIWRKVMGRVLVALPLIKAEEWQQRGFDQLPNCPPIIFQDQIGKVAFLEKIQQAVPVISGENLEDEQWTLLLTVLSGTPVLRKPPRPILSTNGKSRASIVAACAEQLYNLDLQQEHIGKEIPPGFQRLRGIAGSGKTVLLCQKAAHMHLKHPDWDIALVFFSRTLYDTIIGLVDRWLRRFSNGEVQYEPKINKKLRVVHAWGAKEQPGLYGIICQANGITPKGVRDTVQKQPNRGLAELCKQLSEELEIQPIFDAILIDEGQDLVSDDELKYQDKQAIYWMAYQALRPTEPQHPEQRRLIWAYDEAQSLDTLKIPTAKELFGEALSGLLSQGTQYNGGIKKSEIMLRCYRTPGSILTAAHAIGMGLLRPEGMLTGITRRADWERIGYEVTGKFIPGQQITLHRPSENSPNPVSQLWGVPVLEFETYNSRQEEMSALAEKIWHNLGQDDLKPSRDILVVVLGSTSEAMELENHVAAFLMEQGIDIYIPTALELNEIKPRWPHYDPDRFWMEGGVTVSRVPRAKGNEADMVYVVGCDRVARNESDVSLRNQLFVALTRARGWVSLSGVGNYPLYEEMRRVIESGDSFTFTYKRPLKRDIG